MSKTTIVASGETSTETQETSSVVKLNVRVARSYGAVTPCGGLGRERVRRSPGRQSDVRLVASQDPWVCRIRVLVPRTRAAGPKSQASTGRRGGWTQRANDGRGRTLRHGKSHVNKRSSNRVSEANSTGAPTTRSLYEISKTTSGGLPPTKDEKRNRGKCASAKKRGSK